MNTTPQVPSQGNPRIYVLHPFPPTAPLTAFGVPRELSVATLPPRQPLPQAVIDPSKPLLKLGLDVQLQLVNPGFIRRLEGADSPVAAVIQARHGGR
ncbi:MAG: hypothetical protein HY043_15090 [Verrucomicrobia bacterium]|nr:hypothetical protein [Verrucomicrobiota bacterium]